ncbi:MAG: beta-N-acetylhexosaminidase [Alphaproteobacteria bacterium]
MSVRAVIFGCDGHELTADEVAFFREVQPWGFILFGRNCGSPEQVRRLTSSMRALLERPDAPILVDQEGGRVQRLRAPNWKARPVAAAFGTISRQNPRAARDLAYDNARLMAAELCDLGINVDCTPCVDVPVEGAHNIIGDRAFANDPWVVASLGQAVIDGMMDSGVLPVIKHIPGHGRARADSHMELPVVDTSREELERTDFTPFRALARAPLGMTAHVVYSAIDPTAPATTSKKVIDEVVRGFIGFDGLLMTDDLTMRALKGSLAERTKASIAAGCDMILHCTRNMDEMREIADAAPMLSGKALERAQRALAVLSRPKPVDIAATTARVDGTLGA